MRHLSIIKSLLLIAAITIGITQSNAQIMWKISSGNGVDSYVLGTHHVAPISILDSIAGFNDAFNSCTQVYGELDMSTATTEIMMKSQQYMIAPPDSTLSKVLTADEMAIVDAAMQKYVHMPVAQFEMLKPAALSTQITVLQSMQIFSDFDPTKQIDGIIQQWAAEKGKTVKGFETSDFQMQMLFGTPIAYQAKDLIKMVKDEAAYMEYSRHLADVYMNQDLDGMLDLMNDPNLGFSDYEAATMIYNRNANWAKQLETILPTTPTFIVVGAGHLPGEKGLLTQLRNAGYTVTPVK